MVVNFLNECLDYAGGLEELPPIWDGESDFYRAICECKMATGAIDYLIVGIDSDKNIFGAKAFGTGMIQDYMTVYPYDFGDISVTKQVIKINPSSVSSEKYIGEWGVVGVNNAEEAYDWVVAHRTGVGAITRKPEKLKEKIKEILATL